MLHWALYQKEITAHVKIKDQKNASMTLNHHFLETKLQVTQEKLCHISPNFIQKDSESVTNITV